MAKTTVLRSAVKIGQTIYTRLKLEEADVVPSLRTSSTGKRIQKGEAIKRMGIVLRVDSDKLKVAYLATFAHARSLRSTGLDPNGIQNWYPITPAPKEGSLDPLNPLVPAKQAIAQWVSLRKSFDVSDKKVEVLRDPVFDTAAIAAVVKNLKTAI